MSKGVKFWIVEILKEILDMLFSLLKVGGYIVVYSFLFFLYWCISVGLWYTWYQIQFGESPNLTNIPFAFNIFIPIILIVLTRKYINRVINYVTSKFYTKKNNDTNSKVTGINKS